MHIENGTTLQSGTKTVPKRGPSYVHENGSTVDPFRLRFFLSVPLLVTSVVISKSLSPMILIQV